MTQEKDTETVEEQLKAHHTLATYLDKMDSVTLRSFLLGVIIRQAILRDTTAQTIVEDVHQALKHLVKTGDVRRLDKLF